MQPYFFPYIGYFQLISLVDTFVIYDDVNFIKRSWINRNKLLIHGKANLVTVPVSKVSQHKLISQIKIVNTNWDRKLKKTIQMNYRRSPFFNTVYPLIEDCLAFETDRISVFNVNAIGNICAYLDIDTEVVKSSTTYENSSLSGQDRIIDICEKEQATQYINVIGGIELYSKPLFERRKIGLGFLEPNLTRYLQFNSQFVPSLSIIDVLMFNSVTDVKKMLSEYTLL